MNTDEAAPRADTPFYRIQLLGPLHVFNRDGDEVGELGNSIEKRVLLALALRAGKACSRADLIQAGWGWDNDAASLPTCLSRLRHGWQLSDEIPKGKKGTTAHTLDLPRSAVDALSFIDITMEANPSLDAFNDRLGLWRDDPRSLDAETPDWVWTDLTAAVDRAVAFVASLTDHERARLTNLPRFLEIVKRRSPKSDVIRRGRLLVVEDNPLMVETLRGVLHDFECVVAATAADAISYVLDESLELAGAIVDRHLSSSLDSAGLTVLGCMRDVPARSHVPRVLLTSDTPEGPDLEIRKIYGLFAIVTKGGRGASAPGIRDVVEAMLSDPRARAVARFEGEGTALGHSLGRSIATARRIIRQQGGNRQREARLAELEVLQDEFHEDQDCLEASFASRTDSALTDAVDGFLAKWRERVDSAP